MAAKKKPKRDACYRKVKARYTTQWWNVAISVWIWGFGKVPKGWRKKTGVKKVPRKKSSSSDSLRT